MKAGILLFRVSFSTLSTNQMLQVHQSHSHLISIFFFLLEYHQTFILFLQTKQLFENVNLHLYVQVFPYANPILMPVWLVVSMCIN